MAKPLHGCFLQIFPHLDFPEVPKLSHFLDEGSRAPSSKKRQRHEQPAFVRHFPLPGVREEATRASILKLIADLLQPPTRSLRDYFERQAPVRAHA